MTKAKNLLDLLNYQPQALSTKCEDGGQLSHFIYTRDRMIMGLLFFFSIQEIKVVALGRNILFFPSPSVQLNSIHKLAFFSQ